MAGKTQAASILRQDRTQIKYPHPRRSEAGPPKPDGHRNLGKPARAPDVIE
jgi:hypothetical protein